MTDEQIKHMTERFLQWKLPANFNPDNGISFEPEFNVAWNAKHGRPPQRHEPVGTNLLDYEQAEAMVRHVVAELPDTRTSATADLLAVVGEAREGVAAARDFIDTEPALDDHKCPVANCQRCKRRLAAYAAVNTVLTRLDAILAGDAA